MSLQEVEVRYTVELTHKLQIPEGKTATEVVSEFAKTIYEGAAAQGMTHPQSMQLRFVFEDQGQKAVISKSISDESTNEVQGV